MDQIQLLSAAFAAREKAYIPYSGFAVGAALLAESGKVYTGCNIESASFSPTNCAERTAFFKAVSEGERKFRMIAIVGGKAGEPVQELCPPCGVCRQVMMEFCNPSEFLILLADESGKQQSYTLGQLLPMGFGSAHLANS